MSRVIGAHEKCRRIVNGEVLRLLSRVWPTIHITKCCKTRILSVSVYVFCCRCYAKFSHVADPTASA